MELITMKLGGLILVDSIEELKDTIEETTAAAAEPDYTQEELDDMPLTEALHEEQLSILRQIIQGQTITAAVNERTYTGTLQNCLDWLKWELSIIEQDARNMEHLGMTAAEYEIFKAGIIAKAERTATAAALKLIGTDDRGREIYRPVK